MTFNQAKKLHNGDEVIAKKTGESVKVLSTNVLLRTPNADKSLPPAILCIEGVGTQSGWGHWDHHEVR